MCQWWKVEAFSCLLARGNIAPVSPIVRQHTPHFPSHSPLALASASASALAFATSSAYSWRSDVTARSLKRRNSLTTWCQSRFGSLSGRLFAVVRQQTELVIKITKRPISTQGLSTPTRAHNLGGGPFESTCPQFSDYASPRLCYKYFLELDSKH